MPETQDILSPQCTAKVLSPERAPSDADDYPLIARIQHNLQDQDAWNELITRRNPELIGWFAGAPGVRHPKTKKWIEGPTGAAQKAEVRTSAPDLAQDTWTYLATGVIPESSRSTAAVNQDRAVSPVDQKLLKEIRSSVAQVVGAVSTTAVYFIVESREVTLFGMVSSPDEKERIESVVRGVQGVTKVVNQLRVPKILLFDQARSTIHSFLRYSGSVVLIRWYSKHWPAWAVFVAIMDLLPRFPELENEADVLESLLVEPTAEGEKPLSFDNLLKPIHDLVASHFRIAYTYGHPAHKILTWVLVDALRRPPRKIPDTYRQARFAALSASLRPDFLEHFSKGAKADEHLIGSWWQPLQSILTGAGDQTLLGNAETPDKLSANLCDWAYDVRKPIENQLGKRRHLFDVIKQLAEKR